MTKYLTLHKILNSYVPAKVTFYTQKTNKQTNKNTNTVAYKPICDVLVLKGFADLLDAMHLSSIAEWLTTLTVEKKEKKNKEAEKSLVSLPPLHCRNFMPLISSFFNNKGFFTVASSMGAYMSFIQFQPTALFLSLSFAFILFKYSLCDAAVFMWWLYPLIGESISAISLKIQ